MLTHPTLARLRTLQLRGMAAALEDQERTPDNGALTFHERLGLLLDRGATIRAITCPTGVGNTTPPVPSPTPPADKAKPLCTNASPDSCTA